MDLREITILVNQKLVAKALGELYYEENISAAQNNELYKLELASGASYTFKARETIWTSLIVDPNSLLRTKEGNSEQITSAAQFYIDAQEELELSDIVLANFLEELNNTVVRDIHLFNKRKNILAKDLIGMTEIERESYLNGHPKALLNKGRIGWNQSDSSHYSPEESQGFKLHWLAIRRENLTYKLSDSISESELLDESFDSEEKSKLLQELKKKEISLDEYMIIPAHPWQWDNIIQTQFNLEIAQSEIIHLGARGDLYRPQVSLRTLSNISRKSQLDIKVPLTILNTSAIRGLPKKYIQIGVTISDFLQEYLSSDSLLENANFSIIKERAGASYVSSYFAQIKDAPYRYHEYIGITWRQSMESLESSPEEKTLMTGTMLFVDNNNKSLVAELIEKSGLDKEAWLSLYFNKVVIPLYHLQSSYGISLVSHGQNIVLKLKNHAPHGVAIKDFGGDLRISNEFKDKYKAVEGIENIGNLPAAHLIHDLYTGHMVTLMRFVSAILEDTENFPEIKFYELLSREVEKYNNEYHPSKEINLLREKFERVIINTVRFQIGYGDSSQRPLPKLGTDLMNPIFLGHKSRKKENE
ncbi:putative siderophore biosynthesis protein IucC [Halobacteriovorax marinus SJ]|uniref:Siderophore biosynthesis protein IucC n=1 Tax=Halobacteriovorax marinus (strain ATCC BAA-682 / DSM 15412 / SJ) TaxID=862908 RepID=E1X4K8_HALMS|nr:IucA/IucC family protein [Halobacteriovorax marinus]CBW25438.1 putative siderophore biosynthesis protein IucC [Halobacteriovorax marinus SJ]